MKDIFVANLSILSFRRNGCKRFFLVDWDWKKSYPWSLFCCLCAVALFPGGLKFSGLVELWAHRCLQFLTTLYFEQHWLLEWGVLAHYSSFSLCQVKSFCNCVVPRGKCFGRHSICVRSSLGWGHRCLWLGVCRCLWCWRKQNFMPPQSETHIQFMRATASFRFQNNIVLFHKERIY